MNKKTVIAGAILIVVAIVLGAFGAHALKENLELEQLNSFETGVRYQMYIGFSMLILGLNKDKFKFNVDTVTLLLLIGILLFSLSIYGLSLQSLIGFKMSFLGPITPLGGLLMIVGWSVFIYQMIRKN